MKKIIPDASIVSRFQISNGRLNILLIFLVIGLVIIAIKKQNINSEPPSAKISTLNENNITKIDIKSADNHNLLFLKKGSAWYLKRDNKDQLINDKKITPLLGLLNATSLESFRATQKQLSEYHLLTPRLTVKFNDFSIAFGNNEPLKHRRYVLIDGEVHLINDLHYYFLLKPANSYISTTDIAPIQNTLPVDDTSPKNTQITINK